MWEFPAQLITIIICVRQIIQYVKSINGKGKGKLQHEQKCLKPVTLNC